MWKPILLDIFSKGLMTDGALTTPISYSKDMMNVRVSNGSTTNNKGYVSIYTGTGTGIKWINYNDNDSLIYFVESGKFKKLDEWVATEIGTVGDHRTQFVNYGNYQIICNGEWLPFVYDGTTLTQLTTTNIEAGSNPRFGALLSYSTVLAGWGDKSNHIYISKPSVVTSPTDVYMYTGGWSHSRDMGGKIEAMCATLSRLFIFTEAGIEYIDRNTTTEVASVPTIVSVPFSRQTAPHNNQVTIAAWDYIFFLTKTNKIKSVGYAAGATEPSVADISHEEKSGITELLSTLSDDQTNATGYYDEENELIVWHLRSKWSTFNDTCIIYDIVRRIFLQDSNKRFTCSCSGNGKTYTGWELTPKIYQENTWPSYDGAPISRSRTTPEIYLGVYSQRKWWEWIALLGEINATWVIYADVIIDGRKIKTVEIKGSDIVSKSWLSSMMVGEWMIGESPSISGAMFRFNKTLSKGKMYKKWHRMKLKIYGTNTNTQFKLSVCEVYARSLGDTPLSNKY